jgi:hypothetical protein
LVSLVLFRFGFRVSALSWSHCQPVIISTWHHSPNTCLAKLSNLLRSWTPAKAVRSY